MKKRKVRWVVHSLVDGVWKPTGMSYDQPEDAVDDYGEENVRPIGNGTAWSLHREDRSDGGWNRTEGDIEILLPHNSL